MKSNCTYWPYIWTYYEKNALLLYLYWRRYGVSTTGGSINSCVFQYNQKRAQEWRWVILAVSFKQGKSKGFESCDRPIVRKRPIWVKMGDVLYRVTLKFDGWPWKTIGHLFYSTSSFVHHFVAIGEFKLELQSGNAQFGSNSTIFIACDLAIWRMTLKNNRAPLLFYFKLCASFRSHWWIKTGVTIRKRPIWVKFDDF